MPASKTLHRRLRRLEERVAEESRSLIINVQFVDGNGVVVSMLRMGTGIEPEWTHFTDSEDLDGMAMAPQVIAGDSR